MNDAFKSEFWQLSREQIGYYAWATRDRWRFSQMMHRHCHRCPCCDDPEPRALVDDMIEHGAGLHPVLDPLFEAFVRAEARLLLRFIPQRSHEERLTGNLVSEIDAAMNLARPCYEQACKARYGETKDVDFLYLDISRGGRIEKKTGGDLAFIFSIELPDLPPLVRFAVFQAKKLDGSCALDKRQYQTLRDKFGEAAAYLFYDMDLQDTRPPMVRSAESLEDLAKKTEPTSSFTISRDRVDEGLPLSFWLFAELRAGRAGTAADSFRQALQTVTEELHTLDSDLNFRVAVLTVGRALRVTRDRESGLRVTI